MRDVSNGFYVVFVKAVSKSALSNACSNICAVAFCKLEACLASTGGFWRVKSGR